MVSATKNIFTETEKIFTATENIFTATENIFTETENIFTATKNIFSVEPESVMIPAQYLELVSFAGTKGPIMDPVGTLH